MDDVDNDATVEATDDASSSSQVSSAVVFTVPRATLVGLKVGPYGLVLDIPARPSSTTKDAVAAVAPGNQIVEVNGKDVRQTANPKEIVEAFGATTTMMVTLKVNRARLSENLIEKLENPHEDGRKYSCPWLLHFWSDASPVSSNQFLSPNGIARELEVLNGGGVLYDLLCSARKNATVRQICVTLSSRGTTPSTRRLWTALSGLPHFRSLEIFFNGWDEGWEGLWSLLDPLGPKIKQLSLFQARGHWIPVLLDHSLVHAPQIQDVSIHGRKNSWRDTTESMPDNAIQTLVGIQTLDQLSLMEFCLSNTATDMLTGGLSRSSLTCLNIQKCKLPEGATARILSWAIARKKTLSCLILSSNFEWPLEQQHLREFRRLIMLLQDNETLRHLSVNGYGREENVSVEDCIALMSLLGSNQVLKSCSICANFVEQGVWFFVALAELLETNNTLTHLNICGGHDNEWIVDVPKDVRARLFRAVETNFSMKHMFFDNIMPHKLRMELDVVLGLNMAGRRRWNETQRKTKVKFLIKIREKLSSSFYYLRSDPLMLAFCAKGDAERLMWDANDTMVARH